MSPRCNIQEVACRSDSTDIMYSGKEGPEERSGGREGGKEREGGGGGRGGEEDEGGRGGGREEGREREELSS